ADSRPSHDAISRNCTPHYLFSKAMSLSAKVIVDSFSAEYAQHVGQILQKARIDVQLIREPANCSKALPIKEWILLRQERWSDGRRPAGRYSYYRGQRIRWHSFARSAAVSDRAFC